MNVQQSWKSPQMSGMQMQTNHNYNKIGMPPQQMDTNAQQAWKSPQMSVMPMPPNANQMNSVVTGNSFEGNMIKKEG